MALTPMTTAGILDSSRAALVKLQVELKPLTAFDLCDHSTIIDSCSTKNSCSARAQYRAVFPTGKDLLFCGNHERTERAAMVAAGATILGAKPKCGCGKAQCA